MFGGGDEAPAKPVFVGIAFVLVVVFAALFVFLFGKITNIDVFPSGFFKYAVMALAIVGLLFAGLLAAGYAFMALLISLHELLLIGLYLLRRIKFQGILLGLGTLFFVISKGLILWLRHK